MLTKKTRSRVIVERVSPEIDAGQFPIKRTINEDVQVEVSAFTDSHDEIAVALLYRPENVETWSTKPMQPLGNDRWTASFQVVSMGKYQYTVQAWIDHFKSWRRDLQKRAQAGQDLRIEMLVGANFIEAAAKRAKGDDAATLTKAASLLRAETPIQSRLEHALNEELFQLVSRYPELDYLTAYERVLDVVVDREKARFSTWYEMFPRSCADQPGQHGTFRDCEAKLPYIAEMGFDVLYLPPIHPIGISHRKGKNNAVTAEPDDVGSPWGIGAKEGGHKDIHPELGTLDDFKHLQAKAREYDIELALDIAFQASPDHPWVKEHPEWFRQRPDGSIQYAENPPKKYQDIYPINFESEDWEGLWEELRSVFQYWIDQGIKIFRVDNPHTKAFGFWEWCINTLKEKHPDVIFLAEAFTRPKVMYRLAKLGYTQSYTYFAWRTTKDEITDYFNELNHTEVKEYFRPNLWPNTPDILTEFLQHGGRPAFIQRLILAGTLGASYGIYGPAFELCEHQPREPGSEEYLHSEKYQIRDWNLDDPESLREMIGRVNSIRRQNPALQSDHSLRFHLTDNSQIICYSKHSPDFNNVIVGVVNLDPYHTQSGWIDIPLHLLGLDYDHPYQAHDLLSEERYLWQGARNYVVLNPHIVPAHVFRLRRRLRSERDFEYYL